MANKQQPLWELNLMDGKNPIHTGGFLTAYDHRQFSPEEVAAREGGQNSMDAGRGEKGITQLVFQKLVAQGDKKRQLLELFEFPKLLEPRLPVFEKEPRNKLFVESLRSFLEGDKLSALLIRDFNTCGLGGKWDRYERSDHFARLVCALNLDDKADGDANSGGSFGLGKTTYAKSSNINTVVYHSVFEATKDSEGASRRLMAAGVYPKHELNGKNYGGFAYFGNPSHDDKNVAAPFEGQEAADIWQKVSDVFGVDLHRNDTSKGTDILILMDSLDLGRLKMAIEDYYFPALISNDLSVRFIDENENLEVPSVLTRQDLDQFVSLYKKAIGTEVSKQESLRVDALNKVEGRGIGRIAFEAAEPDEAESTKNNCVAIMRGTGMVINYVKMGGDQYEPAVGVFHANEDIYPYLQLAENAAHSEWSEHSRRLQQNHPDIGKKLVARVNSAVKSRFVDFQKNLQPDVSVSRSESGLLARLLTGALSGTKGDAVPPKTFHNPVSIHLTQKRREEGRSVWRLQIHDCEFTPVSPFTLTLHPSISLAGDSKKIAIKHMDFIVKDRDGSIIANEAKPSLEYNFSKGMALDFDVEFENPGRHNYVVQCKCVAENGDFDVEQ
ncbi:hypothetical protein [Ruegeria arenilitoris]|uniref:hypothetical protein n=1 Tax=Ruegeria arenilitoris TaxID=1173585 RepID=UPI001481CE4E|nr:hypothetical protein [Ruegeria arenilitoris]